jgi:hypothetical protein
MLASAVLFSLVVVLWAVARGEARPPARRSGTLAPRMLMAAGLALLPAGVVLGVFMHPAAGLLAVVTGLAVIALAVLLLPASGPDEDPEEDSDGGGGGGSAPDLPRPNRGPGGQAVDWEAFDRARERWTPDRVRAPIG